MKGDCWHYNVLSKNLVNHSAGYRIQAVHLRPNVIGEVSVYVHRGRYLFRLHSVCIQLECWVVMIDPFLPLIVVVPDSISHWCDYYLSGLKYVPGLRIRIIIA
jgi:hypothetical protein